MDNGGYVEFCVKKKPDGGLKALKVLYWVFFIAVPLIIIALLFTAGDASLLLGGGIAIIAIFVSLAILTRRYLQIEYEYTIVSGEMSVDVIYGGKSRKNVVDIDLKSVSAYAPYNDEYRNTFENAELQKIYDISSGYTPEISYFMLFDKDGRKCGIIFDANEKATAMLKSSCRRSMLSWNFR